MNITRSGSHNAGRIVLVSDYTGQVELEIVMAHHSRMFTRRHSLKLAALSGITLCAGRAFAAPSPLTFDEMYGKIGVLGLEFSDKLKQLTGKEIRMKGFMAPP